MDIISISLGFATRQITGYSHLESVITGTISAKTLIFAAHPMEVFAAVHILYVMKTSSAFIQYIIKGNNSSFNPTARDKVSSFATIGDKVDPSWPEPIHR